MVITDTSSYTCLWILLLIAGMIKKGEEIDRNLIIVETIPSIIFPFDKVFSYFFYLIILLHCLYVLFRYIRKWHIDRLITGL